MMKKKFVHSKIWLQILFLNSKLRSTIVIYIIRLQLFILPVIFKKRAFKSIHNHNVWFTIQINLRIWKTPLFFPYPRRKQVYTLIISIFFMSDFSYYFGVIFVSSTRHLKWVVTHRIYNKFIELSYPQPHYGENIFKCSKIHTYMLFTTIATKQVCLSHVVYK